MYLAIGVALAIALVLFIGKRIQKKIIAGSDEAQAAIDKIRDQRSKNDEL